MTEGRNMRLITGMLRVIRDLLRSGCSGPALSALDRLIEMLEKIYKEESDDQQHDPKA